MFHDNKYTKIYHSIISQARSKNRSRKNGEYYENHHILPRSLGGEDKKENLVFLTAKEHFICHLLLTKMVRDENDIFKMYCALQRFRHGNKGSFYSRGYIKYAEELRVRRSKRMKGIQNPFYGKKHSDEFKEKQRNQTKKFKENNSFYGKSHNEKTKAKMSAARKSSPRICCLYCKKEADLTNHLRTHGNNCTLNPNVDKAVISLRQERARIASQKAALKKHCEHCDKSFALGMYSRWHGDNCKHKVSSTIDEFLF